MSPRPRRWTLAVTVVTLVGIAVATTAAGDRPTRRLTDEARGELLYQRHCIQCHGVRGQGDGPAADALVAEVPDLSGDATALEHRERQLRIILGGRGAMPGYAQAFDKHDAGRVLRHLRRIGSPDYDPPPAALEAAGQVVPKRAPIARPVAGEAPDPSLSADE